jgi:acyl carrier protein
MVSAMERKQKLADGDACSVWITLNFDPVIYEIFSGLMYGRRVELVPVSIGFSSQEFIAWLSERNIRSAYIPPFMLEDYADWLKANPGGGTLRRLLVGVEPIPERVLVEISREIEGVQVVNGYGPTEAAICATLYSVEAQSTREGRTPIGTAMQNTQIYLLDGRMEPVARGVTGEIYIGGEGLARGYNGRAEATAEKFVPHPFSERGGERLYRSGDLGRYLGDGNIEFVGRADYQVKVRGFRIELGEIETVLCGHESVSEVAVMVREEGRDRRLVAYVVAKERTARDVVVGASELRSYLRQRVPDYMIPAAFVMLGEMPLTINGKVDRRALPAPGEQPRESVYQPSRTPVEEVLAEIWAEVLKVERVGVEDNFFELGGHSLLATQVMSRVHKAFNVEVPLRSLFESPTVAHLASMIEQRKPGEQQEDKSKIQVIARGTKNLEHLLARLSQFTENEAQRMVHEKRGSLNRGIGND